MSTKVARKVSITPKISRRIFALPTHLFPLLRYQSMKLFFRKSKFPQIPQSFLRALVEAKIKKKVYQSCYKGKYAIGNQVMENSSILPYPIDGSNPLSLYEK